MIWISWTAKRMFRDALKSSDPMKPNLRGVSIPAAYAALRQIGKYDLVRCLGEGDALSDRYVLTEAGRAALRPWWQKIFG